MLVHGPYLVRSAKWDSKSRTLDVSGDLDKDTVLTVFGPPSLCHLKWNGKSVEIDAKSGMTYTASLDGPPDFKLPRLGPWKYEDSLPEVLPDYEPSSSVWIGEWASLEDTRVLLTSQSRIEPRPRTRMFRI